MTMATNDNTQKPDNEYDGLTLHGRTNQDAGTFTLYVDLNGEELPVQVYHVHDHREVFDAARANRAESASGESE
jgi:hypothetical protein